MENGYSFKIGNFIHFMFNPPIPVKLSDVLEVNVVLDPKPDRKYKFKFRIDIMFGEIDGQFFMLPGNPFESEFETGNETEQEFKLINEEITVPGEKIYGVKVMRIDASSDEFPGEIILSKSE